VKVHQISDFTPKFAEILINRAHSKVGRFAQVVHPRIVCSLLVMILFSCLGSVAQTTLYNGIELPAVWPPTQQVSQQYTVPGYITNPPAVIPIDIGRQLFVDDFLIEQTTLTKSAHRPVMYSNNPVLAPGGFDSKGSAFPYSDGVWYDPADHLFKMWYLGGYENMICYAYSKDGKDWIKPALRDAVVPGTNMVLQIGGQRDSDTVWMDLEDPDPSRKFKAFALASAPIMNVYFSPDGIHWSGPQPQTIDSLSDRTTIFRNPFRKVWVESARMTATLPPTSSLLSSRPSRLRYYSESSDLTTWTPASPASKFWTGPDEKDPPYAGPGGALPELYNLDAVAYESLMVGLFSWFNPGQSSGGGAGPNLVELGVGFSRDGFSWVRPARGGGNNAFIPASNVPGTWNMGNTQSVGGGFLVVGDELWFYFSGRSNLHGMAGTGSTGLATMRRDGFYSMDAGNSEGALLTRKVLFSGGHLFVNVNDPQGALQVEVLDSDGNVIVPFTKQNSAVVSVNNTQQEVTWNGTGDLSSLAGRPVRFRFYLTSGQLYSFWVSKNSNGASGGYLAAGGPGFTGATDNAGSGSGSGPSLDTPSLSVLPAQLSFSAKSGSGNPQAQSVNVTNTGTGTIRWTATASQPWITLSSSSGTDAQGIQVGVNTAGLAVGNYSGTITISAPGANPNVQTATLSLSISSGVPVSNGNLVGLWTFDSANMSATQVLDQSGNSLTGVLNGAATSAPGIIGEALSLDGRTGFVQFSPDTLTDLTGDLSLAAWIKTQNNSRVEAIISRYDAAGSEAGYLLCTDAAGHVQLRVGRANAPQGAVTLTNGSTLVNDGKWHHVAVVISLAQAVTFYVDGAPTSTQTINIVGQSSSAILRLGLNPWFDYGTYFTGSLDDVRIYKRALSALEIGTLAASLQAGAVATPVIAPAGGTFPSAVSVSVKSPTPGSTTYYTTDGSDPTTGSPQYTVPLAVRSSTTVKAKAVVMGMKDSLVASAPFTIGTNGGGVSPIAYWNLDIASVVGNQLLDQSGNNLIGTMSGGVTSTAGVIKEALAFDGSTGFIQFPKETATDLNTNLSLAVWVKTSNNSRKEAILSKYSAAGTESGYLLRTDADGHVELHIGAHNVASKTITKLIDSGKTVNDGQWHHVAAVIQLGQGATFYIDGVQSSSQPLNIVPADATAPSADLRIGVNGWQDYGTFFTGVLDDIRIYDRVISANEVAALANVSTPPPTKPVLSVTPQTLAFNAQIGSGNPAQQSVNVNNSGGGTLTWTAAADQPWIGISSSANAVAVQANVNGLAAGNYGGTLTISAPGATPASQTVRVSLVVSTTPPPPPPPPPPPNGGQHFAAPNGSSSGNGSINQPWDLQTALNHPSAVKPGDVIWLRGGAYGGGGSGTQFTSHLTGTAANPILVRQYPGERAIINGGIGTYAPYTWYWGFEVTNLDTSRGRRPECMDTYPGSTGVKLINLVLHDCAEGIGLWKDAIDAEAYGNLIYFVGEQGTTRGHGHAIYAQNDQGTKHVLDNITFGSFDINMQFYGSGQAFVKNFDLDGNVAFNAGSVVDNYVDNIIFAVGSGLDNISVKNSYTYHTPSLNRGYSRLGWQFGGRNGSLTSTGNYWIGGATALELWGWQNLNASGNVSYVDTGTLVRMNTLGIATSQYSMNNNTYYGSGFFSLNGQLQGYAGWKSSSGLDANSQFTAGRPTGIWSFVRANKYEAGRANVVIYNWDLQTSVLVDVSNVLKPGDNYVVKDGQDFFGPPAASGTYAGGSISIPMTGTGISPVVGGSPVSPKHTAPEFGVFILFKQ
jgi:Concanavalin A-like lectin/glucanases superfamily/Chitobiase/beta-hexosaminidase C-terminal domain/Viral BACON domain